jgi:hypothetical protein
MVLLLWAYLATLLALSPLLFFKWATSVPLKHLLQDPLHVLQAPSYIGLYSNLGILVWTATATLCFFCSALLKTRKDERGTSSFLFYSGLLTLLLLGDDFFLMHEKVLPRLLKIGEGPTFIFYFVFTLFIVIRSRKIILQTNFLPLFFAFGFFAISIFLDEGHFNHLVVWEDIMKIFGMVSWFVYFLEICLKKLRKAVNFAV